MQQIEASVVDSIEIKEFEETSKEESDSDQLIQVDNGTERTDDDETEDDGEIGGQANLNSDSSNGEISSLKLENNQIAIVELIKDKEIAIEQAHFDSLSKFLDVSGSKLNYRRYGEVLLDILIAGGTLG